MQPERRFEVSIRNEDGSLDLNALENLLVSLSRTVANYGGRLVGVEAPDQATNPQFTLIFLTPKLVIAHAFVQGGFVVVPPERIADESVVVFFFQQDASGGHAITWSDPAFPNKPTMGTTGGTFSAVLMRKQAGPLYHQIAVEVTNQAVV